MSIIAHTTAEELRAELSANDIANGFANRFLFAAVKALQLLPDGGAETDPAAVKAVVDTLHELVTEKAQARAHPNVDRGERPVA